MIELTFQERQSKPEIIVELYNPFNPSLMWKLTAILIVLFCLTVTTFAQDLSDCFDHGFNRWTLNNVHNPAAQKTNGANKQNDVFIARYKKLAHAVWEIDLKIDSSFGCLSYPIDRLFILTNEDNIINSVILHFPFSQSLFDLILDSYQKKKVKIVKWGLDAFSDKSLNDFTVILDDYLVLVQTEKDTEQNQFLVVLIRSTSPK